MSRLCVGTVLLAVPLAAASCHVAPTKRHRRVPPIRIRVDSELALPRGVAEAGRRRPGFRLRRLLERVPEEAWRHYDRMLGVSLLCLAYRAVHGRWPTDVADLAGYAASQGLALEVGHFDELRFEPVDGGERLRIHVLIVPVEEDGGRIEAVLTLAAPSREASEAIARDVRRGSPFLKPQREQP
ncbi:MAG: hypothetical protein ACLF0G_02060 [Candidatus Brocadiia bacterium]